MWSITQLQALSGSPSISHGPMGGDGQTVASACRPYPFNLVKFERSLVSVAVTLSMNSLFIEVNICCLALWWSHSLKEDRKKKKKEEEEEEEEEVEGRRRRRRKRRRRRIYLRTERPRRDRTLLS